MIFNTDTGILTQTHTHTHKRLSQILQRIWPTNNPKTPCFALCSSLRAGPRRKQIKWLLRASKLQGALSKAGGRNRLIITD